MDDEALFAVALAKTCADERHTFLMEACAGEPMRLARIEALLRAHEHPDSFLEPPHAAEVPTTHDIAPEGPGTVIGCYELVEQIGAGGFGVVFMAEQTEPVRRKVALKVLKPGMDTWQVVARFEAERQALALMDHPNIAHVFDGGQTDSGRPYFVMELVKGIAITRYCDNNSLPIRERLELFVTVCQAVQHAHQKGIIHRDLKPSNILASRYDTHPIVKIIDFGIAKAIVGRLSDATLLTHFAQMIGTPMYMSPEQAQPGGVDIDTRTDIYALGVILYELLTGTTPFDAHRLGTAGYDEMQHMIRDEEPARPSTRISTLRQTASAIAAHRQCDPRRLRSLLRNELDWIVMKALEKDRNRRYDTASAFAADVLRYLHDEPVLACPPSVGYRLRKIVRRNKGPALALAMVVLVLLGGIIGTTWGLIRATDAEATAIAEAQQKAQALTAARQSADNAQNQLFRVLLQRARTGRFSGRAGQRFDGLEALAEAAHIARTHRMGEAELLELRSEAVACLVLPDLRRERTLLDQLPHEYWVAIDPDFRYLAWSDRQGNIRIHRIADGVDTGSIPGPGPATEWVDLVFSPDGARLAVAHHLGGGASQFAVWDIHDGKPGPRRAMEHWFMFSPDSRAIAGVRADGAIAIYESTSGREIKRFGTELGATGVIYHPDGRQAVITLKEDRQLLVVIDLDTGKEVVRYRHPLPTGQLVWRGDGRLLAVACADQRIHVWDHQRRQLQSVLDGHTSRGIGVQFSHAGDMLISTGWDGTTRFWDPVSGRQLLQLTAWPFVAIRRDDRQAALRDHRGRLLLYEVVSGWECRTWHRGMIGNRTDRPRDWGPRGLAISADGRLLASACFDGVRLWDTTYHTEVAHVQSGMTVDVQFAADGRSLFTNGVDGLQRWPMCAARPTGAPRDEGIVTLHIGPPQSLDVPGNWAYAGLARDRRGRWLVAVDHAHDRAVVLDLTSDQAAPDRQLLSHTQITGCAVSPDGLWIATWGAPRSNAATVKMWDTRDGKPAAWQPPAGHVVDYFTWDSRWLVTSAPPDGTLHPWRLGSWQQGPVVPRPSSYGGLLQFSPDGKLMLWGHGNAMPAFLLDASTRKVLARLQAPHDTNMITCAFSPDGTHIAAGTGNHTIRIWDLCAVRRGLAELGLDWDLPSYPPAQVSRDLAPLRVVVQATAANRD
jgi:serine/threonine protein kinase/WD40 repeat protein